jgi:L-glyceraldehyde 3-phosphate reductase
MAVSWVLRLPGMTSALVGANSVEQIEETVAALQHLEFAADELSAIDRIVPA